MSSVTDKLIVALDVPDVAQARKMVARLGDSVSFYKIGMELAYGGGLALVEEFSNAGKQVFVDLKLHDIGHTVEMATAQIARLGARFLTVHAFPQTLAAARRGAEGPHLQILGVTVMTSYDDSDLAACGYRLGLRDLVALRAAQAKEAGIAGLILSPEELTAIRALVGEKMLLVTPGIRPAGAALATRSAWRRWRRLLRAAPIISWWAGPSSRPRIRAPQPSPSSRKSLTPAAE